jgi:predicted lipoprotein with Yx(FWY)xxD motif
MSGRKPAGARVGALATVTVTAALALAACGSTSSASTTNSSAPSSSSSAYGYKTGAGYTSGTAGVKVSTAKGSAGTYLVGPTGRALYMWVADRHGSSSCSGECAQVWPPLTTTGSAAATGGAVAAELGTTKRSDGSLQVTYKG